MRLSQGDIEVVQRALLDLHEERDLEAFRTDVPGIVLRAIAGEYFAWIETGFGRAPEPLHSVVFWDFPPRATRSQLRRMLRGLNDHPFTRHGMRTGDWGPLRLSDFWSDRRLQASALWRDVYRQLGVGRLLAVATFRGSRVGGLNVVRPLAAADFTERDRLVLRLLLPHFVQGLRAAEQLSARRQSEAQTLGSLGLTPREVEVAHWLARGRTNPEIAAILSMRPRTVEKHVEKILLKLSVENRTAAATVIAGVTSFGPQPAAAPVRPQLLRRRARPRAAAPAR